MTACFCHPLAGTDIGVWMNRRFSPETFTRIMYIILLITGLERASGKSLLHTLW